MRHCHIATQEQFEAVAARIEQLKDAEPNSEEAKELKRLTRLIRNLKAGWAKVPGAD